MRRTTVVATVLIPLLGLTACGSDDDSTENTAGQTTTEETPAEDTESTEPAEEEPTAEEAGDVPAASGGDTPGWAYPTTKPGELLTTIEAGDLTVEVYQVGNAPAPKDGMFVDPETNESILQKGDDLVFVNYVITNNGDPIDLGSSLVDVSGKYADWKWLGGMDSSSDDELYKAQGVNESGIVPGTMTDPSIYTLGTGQTFSYGDNFEYQKGSEITFEVRYTPVDSEGELIHDERVEAEGTTSIT